MKAVMTNRPFLILFATIGGAVGFFNAFLTQLSQLMCSRGYDNVFSGVCASLTLAMGLIGAIGAGVMVEKFGKMMEITKVFNIIAGLSGVLISVFMMMSNKHAFLATFCTLFGVFGFGMYPMALELSVEATYPIDESIGTALIFLSGQLQGGILIFVSEMLEQELDEEELLLEVCSSFSSANTSDVTIISTTTKLLTSIPTQPTIANQMTTLPTTKTTEAADHSHFLIVMAVYISLLSLVFAIFFKTDFKRTQANTVEANMNGKKDNFGFEVDNTGL
jgi:FLVCR family MFS transporter 7